MFLKRINIIKTNELCLLEYASDAVSLLRSNLHGGADLERVVIVSVILIRLQQIITSSPCDHPPPHLSVPHLLDLPEPPLPLLQLPRLPQSPLLNGLPAGAGAVLLTVISIMMVTDDSDGDTFGA